MKKIALLSALLLIIAMPALAIPPDYMTLKLGTYSPQHDDISDMSTGFNGEFALGHYFHPNMAVEFSIGYLDTTWSDNGVSTKISAVPVLLNIKGVLPIGKGEIYALAGGGFYAVNGRICLLGVTINDSDTPLGWQLGVGGNYNLSDTVFLGLEGKYLWLKPTFDVPGVGSVGVHIDGIQATANIGYRW